MALSNNDYRVIVAGRHVPTGDYWEVSFGYLAEGSLPTMNAWEASIQLAEEWELANLNDFAACLGDNVQIDTISAKRVGGSGGPMATRIVNQLGVLSEVENVGQGPQFTWFGDADPINMGRTYFPGVPIDSNDAGSWDAAFIALAQAFITQILVPLVVDGVNFAFGVQSKQIGVATQIISQGLLRAIVGTQRKRLRR